MRPLLIVKSGTTLPELAARRGDYENWIAAGMGLEPARVRVAAVYADAALPAPDSLAGVVVTGSSAMVSERAPWSERTAAWLGSAALAGTPVLGICYGHQLLAHALGGRVARNPRGREIGTIDVRLHAAARGDALFAELAEPVRMQATHVESVLELPAGRPLARLERRRPAPGLRGRRARLGRAVPSRVRRRHRARLPDGAPRRAARRGPRPRRAAARRERQPATASRSCAASPGCCATDAQRPQRG